MSLVVSWPSVFWIGAAQILLKLIVFVKKFFEPLFLIQLESNIVEWIDNCIEENIKRVCDNTMEYRFRPYELRKVSYRKPHSNSYPRQRSGHRIVCSDKALFVFGGFNPNPPPNVEPGEMTVGCIFKELWKFDLLSHEWNLILGEDSNLPAELASPTMHLQGDYLLIYGGTGFPFGTKNSNKLYVWRNREPIKDVEEIETTGEKPSPMYGQAIVVHKHYLYAIGGTDGFTYSSDIHRLNLSTRVWELVYMSRPDINLDDPEPRYRHEIAYDGKYIYVIGGGTSETAYSLSEIPIYDLENNVWSIIKAKPDLKMSSGFQFPANRKCHSCSQFGKLIIIAGGNNSRKAFRDIWTLNLETYQWTCIMNTSSLFTSPLFFHDSAIDSDGCMYIFGGIKLRNNTNHRTNIVHQMWITIPSLKAIAWEALNHYFPKLRNLDKSLLLEMGIPSAFATRV